MMSRAVQSPALPETPPSPALARGAESEFIQRFLARTPAEVAGSFNADQLAAIQRAFGMRYSVGHAVDVRRSVALPWGRYYFVMMAGRDRQSARASRLVPAMLGLATAFVAAVLATSVFLQTL